MPTSDNKYAKKTCFGLAALVTGIMALLFLGLNYSVANLNISPETFARLNSLTALFYCVLTPLAFALGVIGYTRRNDSKTLSGIAVVLVTVPFLILFIRLILSLGFLHK